MTSRNRLPEAPGKKICLRDYSLGFGDQTTKTRPKKIPRQLGKI